MAFLDPNTGQLVIHIVYDGAPYSGKTASAQSLGRLLDKPVVSPQTEEGRTMLFDWMEYEGGNRGGQKVICRVLTVPGQRDLVHRRISLLRSADGIIFVADSRREAFARSVEQWASLQEHIERWDLTAPVSLQLNKRDDVEALPVEQMIEELGLAADYSCFQSTAVDDLGIREAFMITVGKAIRQRALEGRVRRPVTLKETQPLRPHTAEDLAMVLYAFGDERPAIPLKD